MTVTDRAIVTATGIGPATRPPAPSMLWMTNLIALCAPVGLLCVFNAQAIAAALRVWWVSPSPTFSHCFFVIPVSAYLVWGRRHALARLTPLAYPAAVAFFPPLVLISLAAKVTHINEVEQLAFIGLLQVLILGVLGPQTHRRILFSWSPAYAPPDLPVALAMREAGLVAAPVDVFVNYYAGGNDSHTLISSTNKLWDENVWHPLSQGTTQAELGGRMLHLRESVINSAGITRIIWWTYWSGGRFTTSRIEVKLDQLRQALSGGGGSALLVVSTPVDVDTDEARAPLRRALGALGAITVRLDEVGRS